MYNKYNWVTGEVITKDKLNHIENGIGSSLDTDASNISNLGKLNLSGLGMPSNRYVDLTLGESGSTYTAPANGWMFLHKVASASGEFMQLENSTSHLVVFANSSGPYGQTLILPCKKDDVIQLVYTVSGNTLAFRFIYAEGSKEE